MSINEKMLALGSKRSIIREIFEYCKTRAAEIGADKVFDFSIGNPSVEPPSEIKEAICDLLENANSVTLHGYTSAQGDFGTRDAIAKETNEKFGTSLTADNFYMTCGAAASLTISLKALMNEGEEGIVFAPFFTEYRVFIENAGGKVVISTPEEKTFQVDVADFESKITENTKAILPVQLYGQSADMERINEIAEKYLCNTLGNVEVHLVSIVVYNETKKINQSNIATYTD